MIAKQGQMTLAKVDNIDKQINQAMQILQAPADATLKTGNEDPNSDFHKTKEEQDFENWLRKTGLRPERLNRNETGKYFQKWRQLLALGLDPTHIPLQDLEREVAIAAHKKHISLKDLDAQLRGTNKYGIGLDPEFVGQDDGRAVPVQNDEEEDVSDQIPPVPPSKPKISGSSGKKNSIYSDIMAKQQANQAGKPQIPPPPPMAQQNPQMPAPQAPQKPSYADAGIPALDKKNAPQPNVGSPKAIPAPPSLPPPGMQSPQRQKGQASPPPVSNPGIEQPKQQYKGLEIPKGTPAEPEPIPLTKLKPYDQTEKPIPLTRQKKQTMEMPPREEKKIPKAVPSSIKGMLPPIKDDGKQIQIGSEEKPAISPRNDTFNDKTKKKKPSAKKTSKK